MAQSIQQETRRSILRRNPTDCVRVSRGSIFAFVSSDQWPLAGSWGWVGTASSALPDQPERSGVATNERKMVKNRKQGHAGAIWWTGQPRPTRLM
jgi:hypothetical protein